MEVIAGRRRVKVAPEHQCQCVTAHMSGGMTGNPDDAWGVTAICGLEMVATLNGCRMCREHLKEHVDKLCNERTVKPRMRELIFEEHNPQEQP